MAMVFPRCTAIDMLCAATSGFVDDSSEMLSKQRLKNLMDAMNDIRGKGARGRQRSYVGNQVSRTRQHSC